MGFFSKLTNKLFASAVDKETFCSNPYLGMIIDADDTDVIADEQFRVGLAYQNGEYMLPRDMEKAISYFEKAAERGHAVAQLFMVMAKMQHKDDNNEDVMKWLIEAAKNGEKQATYNLAISYHRGDVDGKPDIKKSLAMFRKSAEMLYGPACARMAFIYANGEDGVTANKAIAKLWAIEARNYGDSQDGSVLNVLLEEGDVIDGNLNWQKVYQEAADAGESFAWHVMGNAWINEDMNKAVECWEKAANMGCNPAKYNLGRFKQSQGKHDEAKKLFEDSAAWGKEDSLTALGEMYYQGDGVEKDIKKALSYCERALNLGYARAQYLLAHMCITNSLTEILPDKVMRGSSYLELAANSGFEPAIELIKQNQQK